MSQENDAAHAFIEHWLKAEASEMANSQSFIKDLTAMLGVPPPSNSHSDGYSFEFPVKVPGSLVGNRIDLYRRGHFVWESKQFVAPKEEQTTLELVAIKAGVSTAKKKSGPLRGSDAWDDAMLRARGQAERYVRYLPADEPNPPFIIVCDVGHSFEIYADFTQNGKAYLPFPDPRTFRIKLKDLADGKIRERLRLIWTQPAALDPAKISADVTREIAGYLAELAKSLEQEKHDPETVAQFLTRCLFCMFAEDVGLLPEDSFKKLLADLDPGGSDFVHYISALFQDMNTGTGTSPSLVLRKKLLCFNGGLFADHTVLPVNGLQLGLLKKAAAMQWKNVEPAIFGTLLERALNPTERHALGAHFTPRAYVERLVLPTVIEPLREEWEFVRGAAVALRNRGEPTAAIQEINRFHDRLCEIKVLDPACGSGNFLYVALEHMKRLEGEVLDMALAFGDTERAALSTHTVDPHQFLGIELNPRAASIAELVLWIGYLQWHFRTRGQTMPEEPVLKSFKNIECRDAVLEYDGEPVPARDENGEIITIWDRRSMKIELTTGVDVPDGTQRVPLLTYPNAKPAYWPKADYIVGNPPYIGVRRLKDSVGDGYVDSIRTAYPNVPETSDYVMHWWDKAARAIGEGRARRFGLITTNSIVQAYSRRLLEHHIGKNGKVKLVFSIADHQWVDAADGAAVRVAMTVCCSISEKLDSARIGVSRGETEESPVDFREVKRIGTSLDEISVHEGTQALKSNVSMCFQGVVPAGDGFKLDGQELAKLGYSPSGLPSVIRHYIIGKDLVQKLEVRYIIDFFGVSETEARRDYPQLYQHLLGHVYKKRSENKRASYKEKWWIFAEPRPAMRRATKGLTRFIVTPYTATHRPFIFVDPETLPDAMAYAIPSEDAYILGILSSRLHVKWALAAGGRLGVGNDPRYTSNGTFFPFPFPLCDEATKEQIRGIAEELDAHRKRVQAQHGLILTGLYNVLEKLRANQPLTDKEKIIHDKGLVAILKQLHDDLDAAVFAAYGWGDLWEMHQAARLGSIYDFETGTAAQLDCATPADFTAALAAFERKREGEILKRLVALNAHRAMEEKQGIIHWLRPDYQKQFLKGGKQLGLDLTDKEPRKTKKAKGTKKAKKKVASKAKQVWPKPLPERIRATEQALHAATGPVTPAELAKHFARAKPAAVQEILESLVTLGRAQQHGETFSR